MAPTPVEAKKAVSLWLTTVQLDLPKEDWNHLSRVAFRVTNLQIWLCCSPSSAFRMIYLM